MVVREPARRPRLVPFALVRDDDVVVVAERAVRLHGSSREILELCDGTRDLASIVREMRARHPAAPELERDVETFVSAMRRHGVLEWAGELGP